MTKEQIIALLRDRYSRQLVGYMNGLQFAEHVVNCVFETVADVLADEKGSGAREKDQ